MLDNYLTDKELKELLFDLQFSKNKKEFVKKLAGLINQNPIDSNGNNIFHYLIGLDFIKLFDAAVNFASKVNPGMIDQRNADGLTPLNFAIDLDKDFFVKSLLKNNADPNIADNDGATPMHHAIITFLESGDSKSFRALLDSKIKVDLDKQDRSGRTPIGYLEHNLELRKIYDKWSEENLRKYARSQTRSKL